jgi:hypothetical protein
MMTGDQCREKARVAFKAADRSPDPRLAAAFQATGREWLLLGVTADTQDRLQRELIQRLKG